MAAFVGRWELQSSCDNFENYMKSVGVSQEKIEMAKKGLTTGNKVVHDISRDGTTWVIKISTGAGEKVDKYPEGVETDTQTLDGRKVKVVYTLEGDELVEMQTGSGFTSRNVRKVSGDEMTMTFTANDSTACKRVYKKVS